MAVSLVGLETGRRPLSSDADACNVGAVSSHLEEVLFKRFHSTDGQER